MHYARVRKYGGPGPAEPIGKWNSLHNRLVNRIQTNGPLPAHAPQLGKCHVWTGHTVGGYGSIGYGHQQVYVHRLVWELAYGEPPPGRVTQICGNKRCVRPDHLRAK
jgi:hypothetical protein